MDGLCLERLQEYGTMAALAETLSGDWNFAIVDDEIVVKLTVMT